ncbi:receptor expression-enhancing protein 4-like [Paramacrobiotus metropolitanus]|uniref:receptor expression-enhancing protein 4-like n=1 Tax=Paramacrobiotus metropolitanus TaxID=2943436 RepID=UPI002445C7A6|nr:receptor expression-enhancing protein 4-like [Paramacrobiotus metropolitanus]
MQLTMFSVLLSRLVILCLGILYPAYASYKAIRNKSPKDYVKWMMYWVVFSLFLAFETFTDIFLAFWFPFYYEIKILIVLWLMLPATRGSSILYRKFVHPMLTQHEEELDTYIERAKTDGYAVFRELSGVALQYLATFVVRATAMLQTVAHRSTSNLRQPQSVASVKTDVSVTETITTEEVTTGVRTRRGQRNVNVVNVD